MRPIVVRALGQRACELRANGHMAGSLLRVPAICGPCAPRTMLMVSHGLQLQPLWITPCCSCKLNTPAPGRRQRVLYSLCSKHRLSSSMSALTHLLSAGGNASSIVYVANIDYPQACRP